VLKADLSDLSTIEATVDSMFEVRDLCLTRA
jgi:hypothetical protein